MLNLLARSTHVQYVNVMVPSTIVVVVFLGSLLYNLVLSNHNATYDTGTTGLVVCYSI